MKRTVIQLHNQDTVRKLLGEQLQIDFKAIAVEVRELEEKVLASTRFYDTLEIGRFKLPLHFANRFDCLSRNFYDH